MLTKKVFVFVDADCVCAEKGQFDKWCAFADNETIARLDIQVRYRVDSSRLMLIETIEDRRKVQERRAS